MPRLSFYLLLALVSFVPQSIALAQQDGLVRIGDPLQQFLERQQIAGHITQADLSTLPLSYYEAGRLLDSLDDRRTSLTHADRIRLDRFRGTLLSPGAPLVQRLIPSLYRSGRDFFAVQGASFGLQVNPLLYLTYGRASGERLDGGVMKPSMWQNTRGARVSGHLGKYFYFESRLEETQRRDVWPAYDPKFTAPRLALVRFDPGSQQYDYQVATGILGIRSRHFELRAGRERNRWGFGAGSLLLSDYAPAYDQVQLQTNFWRIHYTNLFAALDEMASVPAGVPNQLIPRKFAAFHRLVVDLPRRVQLEFFEGAVILPDTSATPDRARFDLAYLNPVILYRAVEADRGSADNMLLGAGFSWIALPRFQVYSQLLLDELNVSRLGDGWWGNKWAWLAGFHIVDLPVAGSSIQMEYARLRPYLYSHLTAYTAYSHHNDILGHPAGPNAHDLSVLLSVRPTLRTHASLNGVVTWRGRNTSTINYGSDPLLPYVTAPSQEDVWLLQGVRQTRWLLEAYGGVELLPDFYLDAAVRMESVDDAIDGKSHYVAPHVALRWGMPYQSVRY